MPMGSMKGEAPYLRSAGWRGRRPDGRRRGRPPSSSPARAAARGRGRLRAGSAADDARRSRSPSSHIAVAAAAARRRRGRRRRRRSSEAEGAGVASRRRLAVCPPAARGGDAAAPPVGVAADLAVAAPRRRAAAAPRRRRRRGRRRARGGGRGPRGPRPRTGPRRRSAAPRGRAPTPAAAPVRRRSRAPSRPRRPATRRGPNAPRPSRTRAPPGGDRTLDDLRVEEAVARARALATKQKEAEAAVKARARDYVDAQSRRQRPTRPPRTWCPSASRPNLGAVVPARSTARPARRRAPAARGRLPPARRRRRRARRARPCAVGASGPRLLRASSSTRGRRWAWSSARSAGARVRLQVVLEPVEPRCQPRVAGAATRSPAGGRCWPARPPPSWSRCASAPWRSSRSPCAAVTIALTDASTASLKRRSTSSSTSPESASSIVRLASCGAAAQRRASVKHAFDDVLVTPLYRAPGSAFQGMPSTPGWESGRLDELTDWATSDRANRPVMCEYRSEGGWLWPKGGVRCSRWSSCRCWRRCRSP